MSISVVPADVIRKKSAIGVFLPAPYRLNPPSVLIPDISSMITDIASSVPIMSSVISIVLILILIV